MTVPASLRIARHTLDVLGGMGRTAGAGHVTRSRSAGGALLDAFRVDFTFRGRRSFAVSGEAVARGNAAALVAHGVSLAMARTPEPE